MARRGDLPRVFSRLHPKHDTPAYSVWITGAAMAALVVLVDLTKVVAVSTFALLFYYGVANICALRLNTHDRVYPRIVPALGFSTFLGLLAALLFTSPRAWLISIEGLAGARSTGRRRAGFFISGVPGEVAAPCPRSPGPFSPP